MTRPASFAFTSELAAPAEEVFAAALTPAGINAEFRPFLRMTFPANTTDFTADLVPGEKLFRSWILLFGIIPVEYDDLVIEELGPGLRFQERSSMALQREWSHERVVEPLGTGCRLTDRVAFTPRLPGLGLLLAPVFRGVFQWRHRNLCRRFGTP